VGNIIKFGAHLRDIHPIYTETIIFKKYDYFIFIVITALLLISRIFRLQHHFDLTDIRYL